MSMKSDDEIESANMTKGSVMWQIGCYNKKTSLNLPEDPHEYNMGSKQLCL